MLALVKVWVVSMVKQLPVTCSLHPPHDKKTTEIRQGKQILFITQALIFFEDTVVFLLANSSVFSAPQLWVPVTFTEPHHGYDLSELSFSLFSLYYEEKTR